MSSWETLLDFQWPSNQCDQSGECCRGAAQYEPWNGILQQAANGNVTARNFLSQYQPYPSRSEAINAAPDAVEASLRIVAERDQQAENVVFYRCVFLQGKNKCAIYEDRPTLCRDFPESPFSAIPKCCGYATAQQTCIQKANALREELAALKKMQANLRQNQAIPKNPATTDPDIDPG